MTAIAALKRYCKQGKLLYHRAEDGIYLSDGSSILRLPPNADAGVREAMKAAGLADPTADRVGYGAFEGKTVDIAAHWAETTAGPRQAAIRLLTSVYTALVRENPNHLTAIMSTENDTDATLIDANRADVLEVILRNVFGLTLPDPHDPHKPVMMIGNDGQALLMPVAVGQCDKDTLADLHRLTELLTPKEDK